MGTRKARHAGKRRAVGAARRRAQVAFIRILAEMHSEFFDGIRADRRKLGADLRFGASNDALTKLLGMGKGLDTPWLRLFVWRNAQALVSNPEGPCPDLSLLASGDAQANRQKPSGIAGKVTVLNVHLLPALGAKKLNGISNEDVQRLKHRMTGRAAKTVNNALTVLNRLLKTAVEWEVLDEMPCTVKLLKTPKSSAQFHDFEAYERLVGAAKHLDPRTHLLVLLGGDAGLRCGEMMALEWADVNFETGKLTIERSDWKGHITATKGGRGRHVKMTARLAAALRGHRRACGGCGCCCRTTGSR